LQLELVRARISLLEGAISERRGAEAEKALQKAVTASEELASQHPVVARLAAENIELGDRLTQRILDIQSASEERDTAQQQVTRLVDELTSTGNKLAIAGLNQTLGQLLIDQRRGLPDLRKLKRQTREREQKVAGIGLEQIELGDQRRDLRSPDSFIQGLTRDLSDEEIAEIEPELKALAQSQAELLDKAISAGARYMGVLSELDLAQRQLTDTVTEFRDFLDRTLLWVRTTAPVDFDSFRTLPADVKNFLVPSTWVQFVKDFAAALNGIVFVVPVLLGLLLLGFFRPRILSKIDATAQYVGRISKDRFRDSMLAVAYTLAAAAPFPLLMVVGGLVMGSSASASEFSSALASSMIVFGGDLLLIRFFFVACRKQGLLRVHCGWAEQSAAKLKKELHWYIYLFPLARLIGDTSFLVDGGGSPGGLTIIALMVAAGAFAVLLVRMFIPQGGILQGYVRQYPHTLLARSIPVMLVLLGPVMPLLVVLWLVGYNYTAFVLAGSFMYSFWLILGLKVLQDLVARWLNLGYQRLAYRAAIERRDAAREARRASKEAGEDSSGFEEADYEIEQQKVDFAELNSNSRVLLKVIVLFAAGFWLWLIWAPVVPALSILDEIILWSKSSIVNGEAIQVPVTLMSVCIAVLVGIATGVLAKGMPSLVELVLLHSTNLTTGGRYTANTLLRYTIIGVGLITVITMLGVSWSKAQWLVAALGVGIGFGLQEIVANFISGLVILFERPIRVGDVVTVGETSGVVTRIQIRATTIRDWDRKELLVPNKEFITARLLNWSLSDEITRQVIPVGIAYGSDVDLAMRVAEEVAREHPYVLDDPAPFVIFENFGDNSLNLSLRVYLPSMEHRLVTTSQLNIAINRKFKDAGIVIAFPQRDVHLDTSKPLDIRMQSVDPEPKDN